MTFDFIQNLTPLSEFLSFAPPALDDEEISEVTHTLRSGWLTTGPKTEIFEKAMAEHLSNPQTLALSSCTAALQLGLLLMDLNSDEAVITTPLTFASTVHAIMYAGARPILADVSPDTGNLDPQEVKKILNGCIIGADGRPVHNESGKKIVALLPVHYGGHPADLPALWELAIKYRLNMLEDAAHASGSIQNGLLIGHPGHVPREAGDLVSLVAYSFYATKNMTTGEGGLLTSNKPELLERARRLSAYGISDARRIWGRYAPRGTWIYDVAELGYKFNFTDIQAALGLIQLKKLPTFLETRRRYAEIYNETLSPLGDLVILPKERKGQNSSWHLYPLRLNQARLKIDRDDFITALRSLNIGSSVMFIPIHYHSFYQKNLPYQPGDFPVAEDFFKAEISLPLSPAHSPEHIRQAAELVYQLLKRWEL